MKNILVTGGAGYIGSHTAVELIQQGYNVIIVDNLCNSSRRVVERIAEITGKTPAFYQADVRDTERMQSLLQEHQCQAVIHFAGLKAVGESAQKPLSYYENNVGGTLSLLKALAGTRVRKFVFSSTACVYGDQPIPYIETTPRAPQNPYGNTKFAAELLLADFAAANPELAVVALRYFNPVGAHPSGKIGEDPSGAPNNLMPYVAQVATGKRPKLSIFGNDYPTPDGTCVRDYIHVVDLAKGHLAALQNGPATGFTAYNLGSGHGESVLSLVHVFEQASGQKVPYEFVARRAGDLAEYYANPSKAQKELHWKTQLTLQDACRDTWNWQSHNPNGYNKENL